MRISVWPAAVLVLFAVETQFAIVARAQEHSGGPQSAPKIAADYSQEPLVYETLHASMRYEDDGTGVREVRARLRVQTALGLQKAGQLIFDYNAANEKVEIRSVRVIRTDNTTASAGPEAVQDLSAPVAREAPMYTDARQKHVTVPGLSIGDIVEYDVVTTTFNPLTPHQFWQTWNFVSDAICLNEQLDLNVPRDRPLKLKSPPGVAPVTHDEGDRRIYQWTTSTLTHPVPADLFNGASFSVTKMLKGQQPPLPRQVLFSTFQSWDDIGRWYGTLERDRRSVTPEVRAKADELVNGESSDLAKAKTLYQWVAANIRYVSLSFGVGRYQPHSAAEILTNRYGDCKDKATLLETMLEAEGLQADTVLINSKMDVDSDVPSPLQFDHAITSLHLGGQDTWLDSTAAIGPFAYLLPQLRGKNALVVSSRGLSALRKTPSELSIPTLYQIEVKGVAGDQGKRSVTLNFTTRGDLEVLLRLGFVQLPPSQMLAVIQQAAKSAGGGAKTEFSIDNLKTGDPMDTRTPFSIEAQISGSKGNAADQEASSKNAALSLATSLNLDRLGASALPEASSTPGKSGTNVFNPVELNGPAEYSLTIDYAGPSAPGEKPALPIRTHITQDFASFDSNTEWDGMAFHGDWRLALRTPQIPGNKVAEYNDFRRDVLSSLKTVSGEDPTRRAEQSAANDPQDGEAQLSLGNAYLESRDFEKAVSSLESATKLLPNNAPAHISLARAYLGAHQDDKAIAAFQRAISLDDSWSSLNNAAYYLGEQKTHLDLAEQWAKRSISVIASRLNESTLQNIRKQSAQLTGSLAASWDTLGWIKFYENDLPGAEKYIRAAWDIANFTAVGSHLARIYQSEGRKAEAIEAYAQTLALVPTTRALSESEKQDRNQLASLLGGDSLVDDQVQRALTNWASWRSVQLKNSSRVEGTGQFLVIINSGSKVTDIQAVDRQSTVAALGPAVQAAKLPQLFPDDIVTKLPRAGTLSCTSADLPCTFTLLPPVPAARFFPGNAP